MPAVLQPRFRAFARVMSFLTSLGIALIVILGALAFVIPSWTRNLLLARLGETGALLPVTPASRMIAATIGAVPLGMMVWGLWQVRAMFVEFAAGRVFGATEEVPSLRQRPRRLAERRSRRRAKR